MLERSKRTPAEVLLLSFCLLDAVMFGQTNRPGVVRVVVKEGSDVVLPCSLSTKEDIALGLFDWRKDNQEEVFLYQAGLHYNNGRGGQDPQFKGRVSHFPEELKHGNASIMIRNTEKPDSGSYTCDFPHLQTNRQTFSIELVVCAASAKPSIIIVGVTEDGVLLQCEVPGASTEPEVEWQDSTGNILPAEQLQVTERGGSYDVTLNTTVTKTGRFCCVVKQKEINHEISAETYVPVPEEQCEDWTIWFFGGWSLGVLTLGAVLAPLVFMKRIMISPNKGSPPQRNSFCNGSSHVPLDTALYSLKS